MNREDSRLDNAPPIDWPYFWRVVRAVLRIGFGVAGGIMILMMLKEYNEMRAVEQLMLEALSGGDHWWK